ncbi:ribokinase [Mahella australiensis]|uniref:Ribokinase n=1 Tax=Mahella australiensis (strain DSM 15567 / CIP 107919 / 50-1 BON) TaxID=697281 RepID=F3ZWB9_MAHA5|nr:ribokinase [Mahella australiensis]AEE97528.1 ribokinase [Mahella australiensis 50-1 BON]
MYKDIDILVLGSLDMDLTVETDRRPYPGETLKSRAFYKSPGGKGNNQAVAIARLGGNVAFAGCVGRDSYGEQLVANLAKNNVRTSDILTLDNIDTGLAFINVFRGQNTIISYQGANSQCTIERMRHCEGLIERATILLMQLEIPIDTVIWAASIARRSDTMVVLNPSPAVPLDDELYGSIDVLVLNKFEAQELLGMEVKEDADCEKMIAMFLDQGVKNVFITLGDKGVMYNYKGTVKRRPAYNVKVVDPTGAGSAFTGGLCYALTRGMDIDRAADYASAVAAIAITRMGAQSALPSAMEVERFLATPRN